MWIRLLNAVACGVLIACPVRAAESVDFSLSDYRGKQHQLTDYADSEVVVLAFLGTECPLVKIYSLRLQQLSEQFADRGVTVIGIDSNRQDAITDIAAFVRNQKLTFPVLKDLNNTLADQVQAERTPEVVVLDKDRNVQYRGRIDDRYGVGYSRPEITHDYLTDAILSVLNEQPVKVAHVAAEGCLIGRARPIDPTADVTYAGDVAAILNRHCVECHRAGEIAPFSLTDYNEVAGWSEMIREVIGDQRMPPWHADPAHGKFSNARAMTEQEKDTINRWVLAGAPPGDLSTTPPIPPKAVQAWHLGQEPDQIITMGQQFNVPAEGEVKYRYYEVDPGFTEDKWIQAAEIQPGDRAVVHHVLVFARPPKARKSEPGAGGGAFLCGYVPGSIPMPLPHNMAKLVPAGSKLVFQMHYTPIGVERTDESRIGLYFADPADVEHVVVTQEVVNHRFTIPAGDRNYEVDSLSQKAPVAVQLLAMMPHMHVRGKSFRYEARFPDGSTEVLLNVPHYDFNWQTGYRLAEPRSFPAGTQMYCVAHFDNSTDNRNNPDATVNVGWGDQTWNEMMIGYFDVAVALRPTATSNAGEKDGGDAEMARRVQRLLKQHDANGDRMFQRSEVPADLLPAFIRLDADKNDVVDADELKQLAKLLGR